jgi:hypothetical protein
MHTVDYAAALKAGTVKEVPDSVTFDGGLLLRRDGKVVGAMSASGADRCTGRAGGACGHGGDWHPTVAERSFGPPAVTAGRRPGRDASSAVERGDQRRQRNAINRRAAAPPAPSYSPGVADHGDLLDDRRVVHVGDDLIPPALERPPRPGGLQSVAVHAGTAPTAGGDPEGATSAIKPHPLAGKRCCERARKGKFLRDSCR